MNNTLPITPPEATAPAAQTPQHSKTPTLQPPITPSLQPPPTESLPSPTAPPLSIVRTRNGRVARLPKAARDRLNQLLDDGLPFAKIIPELGPDAKGLTPSHISSWKKGGYQDYLRQQQRLEACRLSHDFLSKFLTTCQGVESYQAAPKLAASLLCEVFANLGPETVRRALEESPRNAFRLLNALARILSGGLRCERFLAQKAAHDATAAGTDPEKGMTPPTFDQINENLHLM